MSAAQGQKMPFGEGAGPLRLPAIREDLRLMPGPRHRDGSPSWRILDPLRNQFFRLTWAAVEILKRWHLGTPAAIASRRTMPNDSPPVFGATYTSALASASALSASDSRPRKWTAPPRAPRAITCFQAPLSNSAPDASARPTSRWRNVVPTAMQKVRDTQETAAKIDVQMPTVSVTAKPTYSTNPPSWMTST